MKYKNTRRERIIKRTVEQHVNYYKEHYPFDRPNNRRERFLFLFMNYRFARKLLKGKFVEGPSGQWLKVNHYFNQELGKQVQNMEQW